MGEGTQGEEASKSQKKGSKDRGGRSLLRGYMIHSGSERQVQECIRACCPVCHLQSDDNDPSGEEEFSGTVLDQQVC